jgi:hypothetical protein
LGRAGVRLRLVFVVAALFVAIAAFFFVQPAVEQTLTSDGEIEGYGFGSRGLYAETHGSPSTLGDTVGRLDSFNGDPNRLSVVCDHNLNGVNAQQYIYKQGSFPGDDPNVANVTTDGDGAGGDCGREVLDHSRMAHAVKEFRFGNRSYH